LSPRLGESLVVQLDVEVHHGDAGLDGLLHRRDQAHRVGRGHADEVDLLGDEVFDRRDLGVDVGLGVHAHRHQRERPVGRRELARALLHALEELVGQGLHDQTDHRLLVVSTDRRSGQRQCQRQRGCDYHS
jgi:hypothetical protein